MSEPTNSSRARTLRDIARALGISHVTVSLGLRRHPKIPPERQRQIQETAREMGYSPNPVAAALSRYKPGMNALPAGAVVAWVNFQQETNAWRRNDELRRYWHGAYQETERRGYRLEEFTPVAGWSAEQLERRLADGNIHGLLIPPRHPVPLEWRSLQWTQYPGVMLGQFDKNLPIPSIAADDVYNAMMAYSTARARGYRRIGVVCEDRSPQTESILAGLSCAQAGHGDDAVPALRLTDPPGGRLAKTVADWFGRYRPDAVLLERAELLRESGKEFSFPEEIGVVLLDLPKEFENGLAGIRRNVEEIGRVAVEILVAPLAEFAVGTPASAHRYLIEGSWADGPSLPSRQ